MIHSWLIKPPLGIKQRMSAILTMPTTLKTLSLLNYPELIKPSLYGYTLGTQDLPMQIDLFNFHRTKANFSMPILPQY